MVVASDRDVVHGRGEIKWGRALVMVVARDRDVVHGGGEIKWGRSGRGE